MNLTFFRTSAYRRLSPLLATAVAYFPGLALPFVVAAGLPQIQAASIFIAYAVALAINGTVGSALEMNVISRLTPVFSRYQRPTVGKFTALALRSIGLTSVVATAIVPFTLILIVGRSQEPMQVAIALIGLAPLPIIYAVSCNLSGAVIASGQTSLAILTQSLRALPPLFLIIICGNVSLALISVAFLTGELLRAIVLWLALARFYRIENLHPSADDISTEGVLWQSGATSVSQVGPLVNRSFVIAGGPASVIAYEISDRIFSAGNQMLTSGVLLPRLPRWAGEDISRKTGRDRIFVELSLIVLLSAAASSLGVIILTAGIMGGIMPTEWHQGARWGMLLLASLPFTLFISAASKILIIQNRQKLLLPLTLGGLASNFTLNFVFYQALGTTGVIVALSVSRVLLATVYGLVLRRILVRSDDLEMPRTIFSQAVTSSK